MLELWTLNHRVPRMRNRTSAWLKLRQRLLVATAYTLLLNALPNDEQVLLVGQDLFGGFGGIFGGWMIVYCLLLAGFVACYLWLLAAISCVQVISRLFGRCKFTPAD
jgi:hypothetical protein